MENTNQRYLYYENQWYHHLKEKGNASDDVAKYCRKEMEELCCSSDFSVRKVSIVIVSYNHAQMMRACIESIRANNLADTYELVVVDNASDDGIVDWLREQDDIVLVENEENKGFPYACNQGIAASGADNDIFLLNNDTIVPKDALYYLRVGLYEDRKIGAVGSVSNNVVNYQQVAEQFGTVEEWIAFAERNNVSMDYPYEKKGWLVGFAMLIKREAIMHMLKNEGSYADDIPEVLDVRFSPGNYEDNDLSIRLLQNGYQLLLCRNSFIFHYGGSSFGKEAAGYMELLHANQKKLEEKYGIDFLPYSYVESGLLDMMRPQEESFTVLEIGAKLGATLARIQSRYPHASVKGIESNARLAALAAQVSDVACVDFEGNGMQGSYDYVIVDKVLEEAKDPELFLGRVKECIRHDTLVLAVVRNAQCVRKPAYGLTLDEMLQLFRQSGLQIRQISYRNAMLNQKEQEAVRLETDEDEQIRYTAEKFVMSLSL